MATSELQALHPSSNAGYGSFVQGRREQRIAELEQTAKQRQKIACCARCILCPITGPTLYCSTIFCACVCGSDRGKWWIWDHPKTKCDLIWRTLEPCIIGDWPYDYYTRPERKELARLNSNNHEMINGAELAKWFFEYKKEDDHLDIGLELHESQQKIKNLTQTAERRQLAIRCASIVLCPLSLLTATYKYSAAYCHHYKESCNEMEDHRDGWGDVLIQKTFRKLCEKTCQEDSLPKTTCDLISLSLHPCDVTEENYPELYLLPPERQQMKTNRLQDQNLRNLASLKPILDRVGRDLFEHILSYLISPPDDRPGYL